MITVIQQTEEVLQNGTERVPIIETDDTENFMSRTQEEIIPGWSEEVRLNPRNDTVEYHDSMVNWVT